MKKYLTIGEAAKILGVSKETLRRWDKAGKFSSTRHPMNNYRVYTEDQVNQFLKQLSTPVNQSDQNKFKKLKPFFATDLGKLYHEDALILLKTLPEESVDLIFADPPYNIKKAEWDSFSSQKEYVAWSMEWIKEARRVLKPTGSLFICGFSEILADLKWAASPLFKGCKWLVWFYRNKGNLGKDWGRSHESILHFRVSKKFIFNIDEVRIPYNAHTLKYPQRKQAESSHFHNDNSTKKEYVWQPHPLGAKPKDVLEIPTLSNSSWEKTSHKTQKPVELLRRIILSSTHENHLVLDPFGGSGTTYAVAEATNRQWIGSELEKEYCKIIKKRVSDKDHIQRILTARDEKEANKRRSKLRGEEQ